MSSAELPRILLVGGAGGLVGRALLPELVGHYRIRSVHRQVVPVEQANQVEWVPGDVSQIRDWRPLMADVDVVVNLAWYRWASAERFRALASGLLAMVEAARSATVRRIIQISVPDAPPTMEHGLPYLAEKRRVDAAIAASGLSFRILRGSLLFGPGDRLLSVMLGLIHRYRRFPMFGDGAYRVNPVWVGDLTRSIRLELARDGTGTATVGGPHVYRYHELTDLLFQALALPARYVHLGPRASVGLAWIMQHVGLATIYAYEVEWLMSDLLNVPPYPDLDRPLAPVEPFLSAEAHRLQNLEATHH